MHATSANEGLTSARQTAATVLPSTLVSSHSPFMAGAKALIPACSVVKASGGTVKSVTLPWGSSKAQQKADHHSLHGQLDDSEAHLAQMQSQLSALTGQMEKKTTMEAIMEAAYLTQTKQTATLLSHVADLESTNAAQSACHRAVMDSLHAEQVLTMTHLVDRARRSEMSAAQQVAKLQA